MAGEEEATVIEGADVELAEKVFVSAAVAVIVVGTVAVGVAAVAVGVAVVVGVGGAIEVRVEAV